MHVTLKLEKGEAAELLMFLTMAYEQTDNIIMSVETAIKQLKEQSP